MYDVMSTYLLLTIQNSILGSVLPVNLINNAKYFQEDYNLLRSKYFQ